MIDAMGKTFAIRPTPPEGRAPAFVWSLHGPLGTVELVARLPRSFDTARSGYPFALDPDGIWWHAPAPPLDDDLGTSHEDSCPVLGGRSCWFSGTASDLPVATIRAALEEGDAAIWRVLAQAYEEQFER